MRIVAGSIVHNEARMLHTMIQSVSWADTIVIYNDQSTDATQDVLSRLMVDPGLPEIMNVTLNEEPMMRYSATGERDTSNEMRVRNKFLQRLFQEYSPCIVVLIDGDELMSRQLLTHIRAVAADDRYDSIAMSCIHLYDLTTYLHVYPAVWGGIPMIDPHVRVLKTYTPYEPGSYPGLKDCYIKPTARTLCLDIPVHIHLKYLRQLGNRNWSLRSLPADVNCFKESEVLRRISFVIPSDLQELIARHVR